VADVLTDLQQCFVEEYVRGGFRNARQAALDAGYAESVADNAHREILGSSTVRMAVDGAKEAAKRVLQDKLAGHADAAIDALVETMAMAAPNTAGAKVAAAKSLLELAGVGAPKRIEQTGPRHIIVTYEDRDERDPTSDR
jgi:phage terminase small subunit